MDPDAKSSLNPELVRIFRTSLPPRRLLFVAGLTIALVHIVGALVWHNYSTRTYMSLANQLERSGRDTYWILMLALFGLLFVLAPATAALSFIQEKLRGTFIFQQMVLLSPFRLTVGRFFGSGLLAYFIAALVLPFSMIAAVVGNIDAGSVFRLYLFLFVGGLCCQAVGLFVSSVFLGPAEKALRGGLLVGPAVGAAGAITAFVLHNYFDDSDYAYMVYGKWHFYALDMPASAGILGVLAFTGAWSFAGAVRRVKSGQLIPVHPKTVWLFFASAEALLVGLLWGWQKMGSLPSTRLTTYLFFNWVALMLLAGSNAVGRGRLREWWSAGQDPLAIFQRQGIKDALHTFLVALGIAEAGLAALWISFHATAPHLPFDISLHQLIPIALAFALTASGMAAFIQYCAMQKFRIGAWAGVTLTVLFYVIIGIAGAMIETKTNTAALINPLVYTDAVGTGDAYLNPVEVTISNTKYAPYNQGDNYYSGDTHYEVTNRKPPDLGVILIHGLLAQGLLAAACFGLVFLKWKRTHEEMLSGDA